MYHFQKNRLFDAWLLNTLMLEDELPSKDMIYLNLPKFSLEKPAN